MLLFQCSNFFSSYKPYTHFPNLYLIEPQRSESKPQQIKNMVQQIKT